MPENVLVRILALPNHRKWVRLVPTEVIERLAGFGRARDDVFWPDSVSLRKSEVFGVEGFQFL